MFIKRTYGIKVYVPDENCAKCKHLQLEIVGDTPACKYRKLCKLFDNYPLEIEKNL